MAAVMQEELMNQEMRFWQAMKDKDGASTAKMTNDECIVVGAQGVSSIDAAHMGRMTTEGPWELEQYAVDPKSTKVQMLGPDVAIVAYTVDERVAVDGKSLPLRAHDSSVWVREGGRWRCALHTESIDGDPYGRDRHSSAARSK